MRENKLVEKFAEQSHKSWSRWMKYLFENGFMDFDGEKYLEILKKEGRLKDDR